MEPAPRELAGSLANARGPPGPRHVTAIVPGTTRTPAASPRLGHPLGETSNPRRILPARCGARSRISISDILREMIRSFRDKDTERLASGYRVRRFVGFDYH